MNSRNLAIWTVLLLSCFLTPISGQAQEHSWKDSNNQAISAMRSENYDESERLFQKALSECSSADGKATIRENLTVLYEKQGKTVPGQIATDGNTSSTTGPCSQMNEIKKSAPTPIVQIRNVLVQLDAAIQKADQSGNLEILQSLFQKKAEALKVRDRCETLDYAYCLHYRAQVLQRMHRGDEANVLEAKANRLSDMLKTISASNPAEPVTPVAPLPSPQPSTVSKPDLTPDTRPAPSAVEPEQVSSPPVTDSNPYARPNVLIQKYGSSKP